MPNERNGNKSLSLAEARERTPAVNPVEAMRKQLAVSLFGGVGEKDMVALATKLKEMALGGDLKAAKMLIELVLPKEKPQAAANDAAANQVAEALRDLVDEIRITKALPPKDAKRLELTNGHDEE